MATVTEKALQMLRNLPRVCLRNIKGMPGSKKVSFVTQKAKHSSGRDYFQHKIRRGKNGGGKHGRGSKGQGQRNTLPRLGFEGNNTPFYLQIPREHYYKGFHVRRQYPPFSLLQLQRLIDVGRLDAREPIDLAALCNTKVYTVDPTLFHYGINLTDEGADQFQARIDIEVQWTNELTIATIERNGGTITTRYFDPTSVRALTDPGKFFASGRPIPRCKLPPQDAVEFYTSAQNRGYLADSESIVRAKALLADKYGYRLPDVDERALLSRKSPRQIFYGLEPGWIVNIKDEIILKPKDKELEEFYAS